MSKIHRISMTGDEAFAVLQDDKRYARKVGELRDMMGHINGRVGLVETQAQADKLLAQAESVMASAQAGKAGVERARIVLSEDRRTFLDEAKKERVDIAEFRKTASAMSTRATSKERTIKKELEDREDRVAEREEMVEDRERKVTQTEVSTAEAEKAIFDVLNAAIKGLKAI